MIKFNNELHLMAAAAYSGEGIEKYIARFKRETDEKLKERKDLSSYDNLIRPITDSLIDPIMAMGIFRETKDSILNAYWNDTNRLHSNINNVMKEIAVGYVLHGNGFIITDNFTDFTNDTTESQSAARELPWSRYRDMTELYAYDTDELDIITTLEFYNGLTKDNKQKIIGYNNSMVYKYIVGDEDNITEVEHGLNVIPIISINSVISETPAMKDICKSNISLYNKQSELRNYEREASWVILDLPTNDDIDTIALKQFNVMRTDPDSTRGLNYVSPDSAVLTGLQKSVELARTSIESQASRMGSVATKTSTQSGEALKMEFLGKSYKLKDLSARLNDIENNMILFVEIFAACSFNYILKYPKDFVDPLATKSSEISVLQSIVDLIISMNNAGIELPAELKKYTKEQLIHISA